MRSQLSKEILEVKNLVEESHRSANEMIGDRAYVSLVVERRLGKDFNIDRKGQKLDEKISFGWNLRAFDGKTMFERAGDDFSKHAFHRAILELNEEVKTLHKMYFSPNWKERRKPNLEEEILSQIPKDATSETWVHFGTKMGEMVSEDNKVLMDMIKNEFQVVQESLEKKNKTLDFLRLSYRISKEEFLFIDSSVRMSQSLMRPCRLLIGVNQGHRAIEMRGSLGGLEVLDPQTNTGIDEVLRKLDKVEKAKRLKPGRYKVLLSPSLAGVFAHEAFGHSQEADTWMRNRSKAKELYEGQVRVGNDFATIVNNPAIYQNGEESTGAWGSYFFDEEGWLAEKQLLVEKGYLRPPMTDLTSAFRLGVERSANGKREDFSHGMYSRQTNTYFEAGNDTYEELMAKMGDGFLASECFGGMEDPKGMGIQVGVQFLEEVKDGKLTGNTFVAPNGGAVQMTGNVPEYLNSILGASKIEAFSKDKDQSKHPWNEVGGCGKYHKEYVKAGCGGVYLLLDQVNLG